LCVDDLRQLCLGSGMVEFLTTFQHRRAVLSLLHVSV
jgi:hypothetical protein